MKCAFFWLFFMCVLRINCVLDSTKAYYKQITEVHLEKYDLSFDRSKFHATLTQNSWSNFVSWCHRGMYFCVQGISAINISNRLCVILMFLLHLIWDRSIAETGACVTQNNFIYACVQWALYFESISYVT